MKDLNGCFKTAGFLLLCMALPFISFSQIRDSAQVAAKKAAKQSAEEEKSNILVIPFEPAMYNATGDQFICMKSKMTPGELSDMIRRSLTSTLVYNMSDVYNVEEPPNDLAHVNSDLSILYQITKFKTLHKKLKAYYKGYPDRKIWSVFAPSYSNWGTDCVNDNAQPPNIANHKFVQAEITKDSIYSLVCKRYNAHFCLFITQWEMMTRFKNCTDLTDQVFQRDIFIHYTLLDKDARFIDGGVVGTTYQSTTNDITKILDKNLGMLTGLLIERIRTKM